ncbi:hypothetical protein [Cytobacillus praedii]|uniref:hypothetical protein n=1 Tax=Cytobacillus praedii TaxID=1742358 RepID=UPI000708A7F2|nr:hypothetical protein [Cytobacillus praedii]
MEPLRERFCGQLVNGDTYTLDSLKSQYKASEPVINKQLHMVKEKGKQVEVSDDEIFFFLNHNHKVWPFIFWMLIALISTLMMFGVIQN